LIYTVEGLPEDVAAELAEARAALESGGAGEIHQVDAPSGTDVWASWIAGADRATLRVGTAPGDLPEVLGAMVAGGERASFVADLASGLLYGRGASDIEAIRREARAKGGYAVILPTPGAVSSTSDIWGYAPDGLELMRGLRERWGAGGLLNPGAFLV
jgi:hypothetical protein